MYVARIIQEEERRAEKPGGLPDSWMDAWREAVCEGVQVKVKSVRDSEMYLTLMTHRFALKYG